MECRINVPGVGVACVSALLCITATIPIAAAPFQSDETPQLVSIKGIVTNAVTGAALRKAFVRLQASSPELTYASVTNESGAFAISGVSPGTYVLEADHPSFIETKYGDANGRTIQLKFEPGVNLTGINIKLTPQAVISGRVVDEDGDAWVHGQVSLMRVISERGKRRLQGFEGGGLDDQGEFRISQLPPGRYYLSAESEQYWEKRYRSTSNDLAPRMQPTWYPSARDLDGATPIILEAGQRLSGLEIRLRRGTVHRIMGSASGLGNIPTFPDRGLFGSRMLEASLVSRVAANGYFGALKPDGAFEIQGVPSGSYAIRVRQGSPSIELGRTTVQVDERDVEGVSIDLVAPRRLSGTLQIDGDKSVSLSDLTVMLVPLDTYSMYQSATSHGDGAFEFALVGSERYQIRIRGSSADAFYVKQIRYGDSESKDGTISITGAEGRLVVTLGTNGARVVARVMRSDDGRSSGTPPATVRATPQVVMIPVKPDGDARLGTPDQTGGFSFGNLPPGNYKLYAFEEVPDGSWEDPDFMKEVQRKGVELRLTEGDVQSVEVPLLPSAQLAPIIRKLGLE